MLPKWTLHAGTRPDITVLNRKQNRIVCFIEVQKSHARPPENWPVIRLTQVPALQVHALSTFEEFPEIESNTWYHEETCDLCLMGRNRREAERVRAERLETERLKTEKNEVAKIEAHRIENEAAKIEVMRNRALQPTFKEEMSQLHRNGTPSETMWLRLPIIC